MEAHRVHKFAFARALGTVAKKGIRTVPVVVVQNPRRSVTVVKRDRFVYP